MMMARVGGRVYRGREALWANPYTSVPDPSQRAMPYAFFYWTSRESYALVLPLFTVPLSLHLRTAFVLAC